MTSSRFTPRLLKIGKVFAINAAIVGFLLLLLEGAVRVAVPGLQPLGEDARLYAAHRYGPSHGYAANVRGLSLGAEFVTDQYGRRIVPGENASAPKQTILFIGDSVAVGFGIDARSAMPHILDRRLADYRVANAAVTSYTSADYENLLAALLPAIRPEGIIVGFCLNDFKPDGTFELPFAGWEEEDRPADPGSSRLSNITEQMFNFSRLLGRYSRLYAWIQRDARDNSDTVIRATHALYVGPEAHKRITERISRLQDLARKHDAWIEFFVFPFENQLRSVEHEDLLPQRVIKAAASDAGVRVHDLHGAVAEYVRASGITSKSLYLFSDPMHFSPAGHEVVAGFVHDRIAHRLHDSPAHHTAAAISDSMDPPLDQRRN